SRQIPLKRVAPIIPRLTEAANTRKAANSSHRLTFEPSANVVLPMSLLSSGRPALNQPRDHISRHVAVLNHSRRWRQRNVSRRVWDRDAELDLQHSRAT